MGAAAPIEGLQHCLPFGNGCVRGLNVAPTLLRQNFDDWMKYRPLDINRGVNEPPVLAFFRVMQPEA